MGKGLRVWSLGFKGSRTRSGRRRQGPKPEEPSNMALALRGEKLRAAQRVQGSGFRVQGSGFRVQGSGFRV